MLTVWEIGNIQRKLVLQIGKKVSRCKNGCGLYNEIIVGKVGHDCKFMVIQEPTCTQAGYQGDKCQRLGCTFEKNTSIIAALGHDFSVQDASATYLKTAATCTSKSVYYKRCSRCTEKGTTTFEGSKLPHSYTNTSDTSTGNRASRATCFSGPTYYKKCSVCGAKGAETFEYGAKLTHSYTDTTDTTTGNRATRATCYSKATYYKKCVHCGSRGTDTFEYGTNSGHDYSDMSDKSEGNKAANATCTEKDKYYKKCSYCGKRGTDTFEWGTGYGGHVFDKKTYDYKISDATCAHGAVYAYSCSKCGAKCPDKRFTEGTGLGHTASSAVYRRRNNYNMTHTDQHLCTRCSAVLDGTTYGCSMTETGEVAYWDYVHLHFQRIWKVKCSWCGYVRNNTRKDGSGTWMS